MAKDKEAKKEKKSKKIKSSELATALGDPANTSTDIILTPTKDTKSRDSIGPEEEDFYESRLAAQAAFAKPLANKKLNKKVLKTIKKGTSVIIKAFVNGSITSKRITERSKRSRKSITQGRERVIYFNLDEILN
jgi:hypothetical protein